jgi:RES domain
VTLFRCFAWRDAVRPDEPDGPLWCPREFQGEGRHDNPDAYGCLYLADRAVSSVVEQLARFRGQRLTGSLLRRRNLPLALAELELPDTTELIDLDSPAILRRERLRPSLVATRERAVTQSQARSLHERHPRAAGLRWWSTYEAQWIHVTLFDRAIRQLRLNAVRSLTVEDPAVAEAAQRFGMQVR